MSVSCLFFAYFIGSNDPINAQIDGKPVSNPNNIDQATGTVSNENTIDIDDEKKIYTGSNVILWITQEIGHSPVQMTANEAGTAKWDTNTFTITLNKIPAGQTWWIRAIQSTEQQALESFKLNEIDTIRDEILTNPGNTAYTIGHVTSNLKLKTMFAQIDGKPVSNPNNIDQATGTVSSGNAIDIDDEEKIYTGSNVILWITQKIGHHQYRDWETDRKSTRLNSSHITRSRMPSSA